MDEYIQPHPDSAAPLTIDTQNDFTLPDARAEIDGTTEAVPQMQRLVEAFRSADAPVVHVIRLYQEDGSNVDPCRREAVEDGAEIVRPGSDGAELVKELKPSDDVLHPRSYRQVADYYLLLTDYRAEYNFFV